MGLKEFQAADRRLRVLRLLTESNGYCANEALLANALRIFGYNASRDQLRTDLAWLAEQELVTVTDAGGLQIATLTARGQDVAAGRAVVPGVRRPGPED